MWQLGPPEREWDPLIGLVHISVRWDTVEGSTNIHSESRLEHAR